MALINTLLENNDNIWRFIGITNVKKRYFTPSREVTVCAADQRTICNHQVEWVKHVLSINPPELSREWEVKIRSSDPHTPARWDVTGSKITKDTLQSAA